MEKTKKVITAAILLLALLMVAGVSAGDQAKEKIVPSKVIEKTVVVKKQSLKELQEANMEHIKFLRKNFAPEIAQKIIDDYFKHLAEKLKGIPDKTTVKVKLIEVGGNCITFWPYTNDVVSFSDPEDPINLIFYRTGSAWDVQYDMKKWLDYTWKDATGWMHWTYIDDTENGGFAYWTANDYQLEYGSYTGTRYHIRIFGALYSDPHWADEWSIANVHKEYWNGYTHVVTSYEKAENFVKNDFADEWFVGSIWYTNLNNANMLDNDGYAPVIELTA